MNITFTKMQGLGNDFVVINCVEHPLDLRTQDIRRLADRRFGVGCDQVLLVEKPRAAGALFQYRIFNADGSEVEQCGNGARCFARFVVDKGLTSAVEIPVDTASGRIILKLQRDGQVTVDMGEPVFDPAALPFDAAEIAPTYELQVDDERLTIGAISMGNPHAIMRVDNVDTAPVAWLGPRVERHERFPRRVNIGFLEVVSRASARLRVFERGAGETLACGTGACAAMVFGHQQGWLDEDVTIELPGGLLRIQWRGPGQSVLMTGPAETVFEGEITLPRG